MDKRRWIGESVSRKEDARLLRGAGRFADDREAPGTLHVAFARSPFPHARILRLDVAPMRETPGVAAVIDGRGVREKSEALPIVRPLPGSDRVAWFALATDVVRFEGEAVAAVAASDRYVAEDALERLVVEYEPLAVVSSIEAAVAPGAPRLHARLDSNVLGTTTHESGDPGRVPTASLRRTRRFVIQRVLGLPIETRGVAARFDPIERRLEVRLGSQQPHLTRSLLADVLRFPESRISVVADDVGGGFGLKLGIYPEDVVVCLLAIDTGRPVKWIEDRLEHFRGTVHARESVHEMTMAMESDGTLVGFEDRYRVDIGAYNSAFGAPFLTNLMLPGPYRIRDCRIERATVLTNKVPMGAYRGFGQPESNFVREVMVDELARAAGLDPVDVRLRNLIASDELPYTTVTGAQYDSGDYHRCLALAVSRMDYGGFRERQREARAGGRYPGIGFSFFVELTGYVSSAFLGRFGARLGGFEGCTVRVERDGRITVHTGVPAFGQNSETTLAQVSASVLGVPPDDVTVVAGDTRTSPYGTGGLASRTMLVAGGAVHKASLAVRDKVLALAAHRLGIDATRLELVDGEVRARDDAAVHCALRDVALMGYLAHDLPAGTDPGLEATAFYDPPAPAFAYGVVAAQVEVDIRSGRFTIDRYLLVHDCGTQVNPSVVEGQVRGAIVQGLGAALFEQLVYDPDSGQLVNGTLVDYFVPTAADVPGFDIEHLETPSPLTTLGVKGAGEAGTIGAAAALANALGDALTPFGVVFTELPLTPELVWRALTTAQGARRGDAP